MNHFRSSAISRLFKACFMPIQMYRSQWSIYCRKAAVDTLLLLIWVTPSKFFMRPPWDSERSAGFDFASLKQKKIRRSRIRQIVRLADRLGAFAAIKSLTMRCRQSLFLHPSTKNRPWDGDMRLIGLKISWDVARPFVTEAALTVLPPDLV
jgi:hypothetical protein